MTFTPVFAGSGLVGYNHLVRTREEQQQRLAESPVAKRETEGFVEKLNDIRSVDDLLANRNVLSVVLGAFGLQDDIGNTGLLRKVLEADPSDSNSLPNRLPDSRYLDLATAFNFGGEGGAQLDSLIRVSPVVQQLADYDDVDVFLAGEKSQDRAVFRETMAHFEIEKYANNKFFLKTVLESDLDDPNSFANRQTDPNLLRFAQAFDLKGKSTVPPAGEATLYSFADAIRDEVPNLLSADDLLERPAALSQALDLFGIEGLDLSPVEDSATGELVDSADLIFLRDVLNSDLDDENSVANQAEDKRFAALAGAFEFPARVEHAALVAATPDGEEPPEAFDGRLEKILDGVDEPLEDVAGYTRNFDFLLNAPDFFGLEFTQVSSASGTSQVSYERDYLERVLGSDLSDPNSFGSFVGRKDPRFENFAKAFDIPQPVTETVYEYPEGFGQAILDRYLDEEFLSAVGEEDPTLRFALGFEPGLESIVNAGGTNNAHWFSILASNPLREVFEAVLNLPSSFGALDIDRQADDMKERTKALFGTDVVADLLGTDSIESMRNRYLALGGSGSAPTSDNVLLGLFV